VSLEDKVFAQSLVGCNNVQCNVLKWVDMWVDMLHDFLAAAVFTE